MPLDNYVWSGVSPDMGPLLPRELTVLYNMAEVVVDRKKIL